MKGRMVAANGLSAVGIHNGIHCFAYFEQSMFQGGKVEICTATGLFGIGDAKFAIFGLHETAIAYLSAAFGIKRRPIQNEDAFSFAEHFHAFTIYHDGKNLAL